MNERRRAKLDGGRSGPSAAEGGTTTGRRPLKRALVVVLAAALSAVALVGCSNHGTEDFRVNITSANGVSGFSIGTITVTEGDKVNIRVDNRTDKAHGFSIDAFNVHRVVEPSKSQTVSFTPNKTGQYRVYCQLHPTHVPAQMIVVG